MALFKKKTQTPAAPAAPVTGAPASAANTSDDFSDFSPEALDAAADPAAVADDGSAKCKKAGREKKISSGRALKAGVSVGLNIGSDSIKAVEVRVKGNEVSITGMGMVPTPPESISNGVVMSVNSLVLGIRDVMAQAGIKSKKVVTSVSGTGALVVRIIEVPKMSDGELMDNMKMDADRYIPFPPSEVEMDFKALRELPSDPDSPNMEVLLAAAQREVIDLHVEVLQDAKLDPRSIDVEPLAAARILTHPCVTGVTTSANGDANNGAALEPEVDYSDVAAILNIGASGTEISILRGDILVFTRTVPTAGNALTQALVDNLGLAWSDAEQLKRESGDALPPGDSAAVGSTPVAADDDENLDWADPVSANTDASGDEWTDFAPEDDEATDSFSDEDFADDSFAKAPTVENTPAAPVSSDPFAEDFYEQGPSDFLSDAGLSDAPNAEPQEQHQQKQPDDAASEKPVSPFSFGDEDDAQNASDATAKELPTFQGEMTGTEEIAGDMSTPQPGESALLPSTVAPDPAPFLEDASTPAASETVSGAADQATELTPTETVADAPGNPFFDFGHADEPAEKLPTLQEGKPTSFADFLMPEEDDFSDLPTLREEPSTPAPIASAFEFPGETQSAPASESAESDLADADLELPTLSGAPTTTESIDSGAALEKQDENLLPSEIKTETKSDAFSFSFEDAAAVPAAAEIPEETAAAPVAEVDPFAEFMASAEADAPVAAPSLEKTSGTLPVEAASTPVAAATTAAADNLDLDILFGEVAASDATAVSGDDLDFSGLDVGGDDFGIGDFDADFGAGLAGAAVGEIDAKTLHGVLDPVLETLVNEVRRSLEYHTTRYPDAAVQRVVLIGGGAKLKNIDAFFTQKLGLPTTIGNPAARLVLRAPNLPAGYVDENGPLFTVALGLAMRELTR